EAKRDCLLVAIFPAKLRVGLAWLNLAAGQLRLRDLLAHELAAELERLGPSELLYPDGMDSASRAWRDGVPARALPPWQFDSDAAMRRLTALLGTRDLSAFGVSDAPVAARAAGALLHSAQATQQADQPGSLSHVRSLGVEHSTDYLALDA